MDSIFTFHQEYFLLVIIVHTFLSLFIAVVSAAYLQKRYKANTKLAKKQDKQLLNELNGKVKVHQAFSKFALHKYNTIASLVFIFILNFSLPFISYFLTIWLVWFLNNVKYDKKVIHTNVLNLDEFGNSFLEIERIFGEGSMNELMKNEFATKDKKLKALSSLSNSISPVNLQIVRQTLTSTDDEIRMFGYAIINKAEKSLNKKININLDIINTQNALPPEQRDERIIANSSYELAFLYWEMVYTELSHESLKNNFLTQSVYYIEIAKAYYNTQINNYEKGEGTAVDELYTTWSNLYVLMGRIQTFKGEYESAKAEFTIAQELLPNGDTIILPYLAEVYYLTGRYHIVKVLLSQTKGLELNATLYPVVQQWKETA